MQEYKEECEGDIFRLFQRVKVFASHLKISTVVVKRIYLLIIVAFVVPLDVVIVLLSTVVIFVVPLSVLLTVLKDEEFLRRLSNCSLASLSESLAVLKDAEFLRRLSNCSLASLSASDISAGLHSYSKRND